MKNNKKLAVTIGIPAYNEERNIESLINSVLIQKGRSFKLKKIIILSDGSTDNTKRIMQDFRKKYKMIKVIIGRKRRGKMYRLNQLYRMFDADILLSLDADIILGSSNEVERLINVFIKDKNALVVVSRQTGIFPNTFMGKILQTQQDIWDKTRESIPGFRSPHNLMGSASAIRGDFAKTVHYPTVISCDQHYLYLKAEEINGFRYVKKSVVYYLGFANFSDYKLQGIRAYNDKFSLANYLGKEVLSVYQVSRILKIRAIISTFIYKPMYTMLAIMLGIYLRSEAKKQNPSDALWKPVLSTKQKINLSNFGENI